MKNSKYKNMYLIIIILVVILIVIGGYYVINKNFKTVPPKPQPGPINPGVISEDERYDNDFDFLLLKKENSQKNVVYSPLSIKYALKMLEDGANGETKKQITDLLNNVKIKKYNNIPDVLSLANSIFIRDVYKDKIKGSYVNEIRNKYDAEIKYDSFENANNINKWIEDKTFGIIKNMLNNDDVSNSVVTLINALTINMEWKIPFEFVSTYGNKFYFVDNSNDEVTTMHHEMYNNLSYYKNNKLTALTINLKKYDENQFEFMAIMPNKNLDEYVQNLKIDDISKIDNKLIPASSLKAGVELSIPKFKITHDIKLKEELIKLGIVDVFDKNKADLSNMGDHLFVSQAMHKADIDFTEKGIKAAAVTVILIDTNMAKPTEEKPVIITINKPFLFLVRDKKTKENWFVGTVYNPNLWKDDCDQYKENYDFN